MKIANLTIKQTFYKTLNERQRRLYAAQLAIDLGHGSIKVISEEFSIDPKTIWAGTQELRCSEEVPEQGIRKGGGGRKKTSE